MKPPPFTYHRPTTVEEAARLLADLGDAAKVLAGGQSLVPLLNFRLAAPEHLVDVNGIAGLDQIERRDGAIEVGATVRDARLLDDPAPAVHPLLAEAAGWIAHPVIRNRGTVCGSLAHADPAAELPALLALLDGTVDVVAWRAGTLASRRISAVDLFTGPLQTTVQPDELVVRARFPLLPDRTGWAVAELARRHGDYAIAGVMLMATVGDGGRPTGGRAAYLSCAPMPLVVDLGPALVEDSTGDSPGDEVYDLVASSLDPTDDIHATGAYRRHLAATLTTRALDRALDLARAAIPASSSSWSSGASPASAARISRWSGPGGHGPPVVGASGIDGSGSRGAQGGDHEVVVTVNGVPRVARVPGRRLLSDLLRHDLELTGTHVGCEHGVCGACTVLVDGEPVRSCLTFAVMADGARVTTVEGLTAPDGQLGPVQQAFRERHGLQCGFCTPGFLLLTTDLLARHPDPSEAEIADALGGNLCRCTGYVNIVRSVRRAAELLTTDEPSEPTRPSEPEDAAT